MKKHLHIPSRFASQAQRGFAIVAALFLIVTLAALGAFMVTISNTQHLTSAQDVQGSRAYWAARSGLEWAIAGVSSTSACPASPPATINGFTLTITCTPQTYTEASASINIFKLSSVAKIGTVGSLGYIERSVSASIEL